MRSATGGSNSTSRFRIRRISNPRSGLSRIDSRPTARRPPASIALRQAAGLPLPHRSARRASPQSPASACAHRRKKPARHIHGARGWRRLQGPRKMHRSARPRSGPASRRFTLSPTSADATSSRPAAAEDPRSASVIMTPFTHSNTTWRHDLIRQGVPPACAFCSRHGTARDRRGSTRPKLEPSLNVPEPRGRQPNPDAFGRWRLSPCPHARLPEATGFDPSPHSHACGAGAGPCDACALAELKHSGPHAVARK
jgi:hypothetical protein